jgi:hypothetical protein
MADERMPADTARKMIDEQRRDAQNKAAARMNPVMSKDKNTQNLDADYLAALRDTDLYKDIFQTAYQDPKEAIEIVGHYHGILGRYGRAFKTEVAEDPPYETNYSKAAQQIRQFLVQDGPEENNPRDISKRADFTLSSGRRTKNQQAIAQLALTEALESHEQQGRRFVDTFGGSNILEGSPKSTRSMGQTVEPLRGRTRSDGSEGFPFDRYDQRGAKKPSEKDESK